MKRPDICPECGVDRRFRKIHKKRVRKLEASLLLAKESLQKYRKMYEDKCKVANSLSRRLNRLEEIHDE